MMRWLRGWLYSDDPIVKLAAALSEQEARMWQELLEQNGIRAMAKNASSLSAYQVAPMSNDYDLFVKQSDLERAQEILAPLLNRER